MTDISVGPAPAYDPELTAALELLPPRPVPITPENLAESRATDVVLTLDQISRGGAYEVSERTVPGPAGSPDVALLIARPTGVRTPAPLLYHMHGGGMILGNRTGHMLETTSLAREVGAIVVSVEYRLAPEHPDPAPVEDCYAGLAWTVANAEALGVDPTRVVVTGVSAGGGLAAGIALMARDRGGPAIAGQMLICPMLDDRNETVSAYQMAGGTRWPQASNDTAWNALLGSRRGTQEISPYAAPTRAVDLSGLPPALISVGSVDTFRDEAVAFAARIWAAGGSAELYVFAGGYHGFDYLAPDARLTRDAVEARRRWLRRVLS